jgi:hypothetical protein
VTTATVSRALKELASWNVRITVENSSIRVAYRCPASALEGVRNAIAILREHKPEAITLLTEKSCGGSQGLRNQHIQRRDAEDGFANRESAASALGQSAAAPPMPPHIRLVEWNPKKAPIAIDTCSVVVDVPLFIRTTLEQLSASLTNHRRWVGWSVPQLADRLRQAGVVVEWDGPGRE